MESPATKTNAPVSADVKPIPSPLAGVYASAGAKMGVWFGCALPEDFGDPAAEYRFANQTVAVEDKNYRTYLKFTGPDRVRYLNALLTNNIKDLAAGRGTISLLLNPQGHILAELEAYAFADHHLCASYAMIREQLIEWMDKYIIMDDVTLTDETERWGTLALEGPKAAAVVKDLVGIDLPRLDELASMEGEILRFAHRDKRGRQDDSKGKTGGNETIPCRMVKRSPGGVAGAEFVVERAQLSALWPVLLEAVRKHGGGPAGYTALSGQRLAQGVPWFGYDFGEKQIPHEARLENSHISYTKGCYTGQEIVERVRSRGHVNRRRVGLLFSGEAIPEAGTALTLDGKEAGYVTRVARIWDPPRVIGMGYVRKEAEAPGTAMQCQGGTAKVILLPEGLKG
jgi:folate-binding protein YgfZ